MMHDKACSKQQKLKEQTHETADKTKCGGRFAHMGVKWVNTLYNMLIKHAHNHTHTKKEEMNTENSVIFTSQRPEIGTKPEHQWSKRFRIQPDPTNMSWSKA